MWPCAADQIGETERKRIEKRKEEQKRDVHALSIALFCIVETDGKKASTSSGQWEE
jgi:hypothetical protein